MLSRRTLFTLGLSRVAERVEEQFDAERLNPAPPPAPPPKPRVPARPRTRTPGPSWPHKQGAELWEPVSQALPRPPGAQVLEVDELDSDLAWLPFDDGVFDAAVSAFAPMFSSDGSAAIDELFRVVAPGGLVAFTAWTPAGIVGRLLRIAEELDPTRAGAVAPMDWAREDRLRGALERHSDDFELRPGGLTLSFASHDEALARLFGAFRPLAWSPREDELRRHAAQIVAATAGGDAGAVTLRATYVMAVARHRPEEAVLPY